jgi:hypothetical protein
LPSSRNWTWPVCSPIRSRIGANGARCNSSAQATASAARAPCQPVPAPELSTTSTAPPATLTTKPYAPWATVWSASCTAAYATTRSTTNTPPGPTACQRQLDSYEPGMSSQHPATGSRNISGYAYTPFVRWVGRRPPRQAIKGNLAAGDGRPACPTRTPLYHAPMPLGPCDVFAGYTIVRLLGSGGMGEVYLAEHPRLPRRDALKILG